MGLGHNFRGQLGNNESFNLITSLPVQVRDETGNGFLTNVIAIAAGGHHSLAVKSDGTVWAWGLTGQPGDDSTTDRPYPVQVLGPDGIGTLGLIVGNPRPLANGLSFTTNDTNTYNGILPASDVANDPLTFSLVASPLKGTAVITNTDTGAFTYTPNTNTTGTDTFTFQVHDGFREAASVGTATVTIIDTVPPTAAITLPQNGASLNQVFLIEGTASDNASGVAAVVVQITDGSFYVTDNHSFVPTLAWVTATGTTAWSLNTSQVNWTTGTSYTIRARATDGDGNQAVSADRSFTYIGISGSEAFTTCDLSLSTSSILFNGTVDASLKLTKAGFPNADLSGSQMRLTLTAPSVGDR